MVARVVPVSPFDLVVFGGTGDLARRKLLPALYYRDLAGQIPDDARIVGVARSELSTEAYRERALEALKSFVPAAELKDACLRRFIGRITYARVDVSSTEGWDALAAVLKGREDRVRAFYLALEPRFFGPICERLKASGVLDADGAPRRREAARRPARQLPALNAQLTHAFDEHHLYRIDHYLGKETVQNLMALRFANALFEPLWSARHIDHVQITVAETRRRRGRAAATTITPARCATWCRTTCCSCCACRHGAADQVRPRRRARREAEGAALAAPDRRSTIVKRDTVRGQYAEAPSTASAPATSRRPACRPDDRDLRRAHGQDRQRRWAGVPFFLRTGKRLRSGSRRSSSIFRTCRRSRSSAGRRATVRQNGC